MQEKWIERQVYYRKLFDYGDFKEFYQDVEKQAIFKPNTSLFDDGKPFELIKVKNFI